LALSQRLAQAQKDLRLAENRLHEFLAQPGNDALNFDQASLNKEILQSQNQQQRLRTQLQRSFEQSITPARKAQQKQWQARLQGAIRREQDLRSRLGRLPERELARLRLSQGVEFQRLVYQNLLTALAQSQLVEAKSLVQIVLPATPKPLPTTPFVLPRWLVISLAGLAGAMGAMGVSLIILGWLTTRRLTPEKLRQALANANIPLVTCLPLLPHTATVRGIALLNADLEPVYFAFYNHLLQQLSSRSVPSAQVVLVTSVGEREGKTTTAYNLAIASARANRRTLLIEADLKKPSPAQCLNVELPQPHPRRVLNFCADPQDAIYLVPEITNLFILPSVGPVRPAESLLVTQKIQSLLAMMRCRFDLVIIDAPSLTQAKYSRDLELCSDSLLLVTRAGYTSIPLLKEVFNKTKQSDLTLWGAVINGVDDLLALALNNLREELSSTL
jgi:Mrp family chromosome partitioning ATPase